MLAAGAMGTWDAKDWEIEVTIPGTKSFFTKASSILVNNQARIGSTMIPAPFTSNTDGLVNLLITDAVTLKDQVQAVVSMRRGEPERLEMNRSFELPEFRLKSKDGSRPLTFFGDGEILLEDAREITVRCLHQGLSVVVR
jgi:diacylglycerol kinase family enzyme